MLSVPVTTRIAGAGPGSPFGPAGQVRMGQRAPAGLVVPVRLQARLGLGYRLPPAGLADRPVLADLVCPEGRRDQLAREGQPHQTA